jgi:tRNA A-37 threonylcarbamoyl transferase component Bud32
MATTDRFAPGSRVGDYVIEMRSPTGTERALDDVYHATHVLLPRRVQLSVMHPTFVGLRPVAVRMMREACILEALRHPGVPRVYEVGVLADQRTQRPWVASELVDGAPLDPASLPVRELLGVLRDVSDVLAHAHARGVAHRGIRPHAIVRGDGSRGFALCVINWGEARVHDARDDSDRACADDVFALGLVADLALGHRAGLPAKLVALVDDMLAPNPMSRPTAVSVRERVVQLLAHLDGPAEVIVLDDDARIPAPPVRGRVRWTPPLGVTQTRPAPGGGAAVSVLKARG